MKIRFSVTADMQADREDTLSPDEGGAEYLQSRIGVH
jgi:hypothetical protein